MFLNFRIPFPAPKEIKGLAQKANPFFMPFFLDCAVIVQ